MDQSPAHHESYGAPRGEQPLARWIKVIWGIGIAVVLVLAGMSIGVLLERDRLSDKVVLSEDWSELGVVIEHVERESYYRPESAGEAATWREQLELRAINGLLQGSGDNHAAFLPPDEAAASSAALTGEYEGVGITITENDDGEIEIVSVNLEAPAHRADVRTGDIVMAVDATPVADAGLEAASELLRGSAGTRVTIAFARPGGDPYEVTMTRERISTGHTTVAYRYFPDEELAVISISLFALTTTDELDDALALASEDGAERLVLDLRGNPGGWVSQAQNVIGRFVDPDSGPALLEDTWPAEGNMLPMPITADGADRFPGEMLVLVNGGSASASEIVASALQHYDRAVVVGEATFGKGSVQRVFDLESGESLRLTVAEWFTPGEVPLEEVGVEPNVEIGLEGSIDDLVPMLADILDGEPHALPATAAATPAA